VLGDKYNSTQMPAETEIGNKPRGSPDDSTASTSAFPLVNSKVTLSGGA
jgi:hypothetical protein